MPHRNFRFNRGSLNLRVLIPWRCSYGDRGLAERDFSISAGSRIVEWVSRPVAGRVWTGLETRPTFHSTHLLRSHPGTHLPKLIATKFMS